MVRLEKIPILLLSVVGLLLTGCSSKKESTLDSWKKKKEIRAQIHAPKFPDQTFVITDYGAVNGGKTKNTTAFEKAIADCHRQGGGKVVVPSGTYLTGAIHLKNNVNLHLQKGATILFSQDPTDYLPMVRTRFNGIEVMNYSPFIYAYKKENIAVTGRGILDGNADKEHWWPWAGSEEWGWKKGKPNREESWIRLQKMNRKQVPLKKRKFGPGYYLRAAFIEPNHCKNVLIAGVTMHRSPMWDIHPLLSENVTVRDVHINSHGPNNDGIDPESSKNVLIKNVFFNTGDDCIAIKSGRNRDGRRIGKPSQNIIIENSHMKDGHGAIVIGSEMSGGVKNVYAQHLTMNSSNLERVLRIKTNADRGGVVQNVFLKDIQVGTYREAAIKVNMFYHSGNEIEKHGHIPVVDNVQIDNLQVKNGGTYGILVQAMKESPVKNLKVTNSTIDSVNIPLQINFSDNTIFQDFIINGKSYSND